MNKSNIIICLILLTIFCAAQSWAEEESGGYAGAFLNYDLSARAMGMGGAFTGVAEGSAGIRYNPAGICAAKHLHAAFTYSKLTLDRRLNYAEVLFPLPKQAVIGISWINAGVSDVKMRDTNGNVVGDLENNQNSFNLTFGRRVNDYAAIGVNVRYVQFNYAEMMTNAIGIDFGAMGYLLNDDLTAGFKVANFSSKYNWDSGDFYETSGTSYEEDFPIVYRFGAAYRFLEKAITVSGDYEYVEDADSKTHFGAEYWMYKNAEESYIDEYTDEVKTRPVKLKFLSGRIGLNHDRMTFGFGIRYKIDKMFAKLDYAFAAGAVDGLSPDHLITFGLGYF